MIDLETAAGELLSGPIPNTDFGLSNAYLRFSADADSLRYAVLIGPETDWHLSIINRDLQTGEETAFYETTSGSLSSDRGGEIWLDRARNLLVAADGRPLSAAQDLDPSCTGTLLAESWLIDYEYSCRQDCVLHATPLSDQGAELVYTLPAKDTNLLRFGLVEVVAPGNQLLVADEGHIWLLSPDGEARLLMGRSTFLADSLLSPDGRYLVSMGNQASPTTYGIYDLWQGSRLASIDAMDANSSLSIRYFPIGFFLDGRGADYGRAWAFLPRTTGLMPLEFAEPYGNCTSILNDETLLCLVWDDSLQYGDLFHYFPATGDRNLIMRNALANGVSP